MDGEDGDTAVWVAVRPCVGDGSVVDRQYLQQPLSGLCHEVYHLFQVTEVANAEARL